MKIYFYESAGQCFSREVTLTEQTSCVLFNTINLPNNGYQKEYRQTIRFTLDTAAPVDLLVLYRYYRVVDSDVGGPSEGYWVNANITIPANQLFVDLEVTCRWETYEDFGAGGMGLETEDDGDWELRDQIVVPDICLNVDPLCDIAITNVVVINPILRGDTNGSIAVTVSGATSAQVTYRLNGITKTTTGSPTGYTFTGLGAGSYVVAVVDGDCGAQESVVVLDGEFRTGDFSALAPQELCAVENPVILNLGTAQNSPTPVISNNPFRVFVNIVDGDFIEFNLTYPIKYTARFTAREFPDKDTYFLASILSDEQGVQVGSNTIQEIVTSLVECIQKDAVLNQLYYVRVPSSPTNTYFFLEAKEANSNLNLNASNVITQGNITATSNYLRRTGVSAWDGQLTSNYSLYAEVLLNVDLEFGATTSEANFKRVGEIELPFNINNTHRFDLSAILKNFVSTPKLFFGQTEFSTIAPMMAAYMVKYGEKYPLIANSQTKKKRVKGQTLVRYVVNSALDWENQNTMNPYLGIPLSYLNPAFTMTRYNDTWIITNAANHPELSDVQYSIWNSTFTTNISGWQTSPAIENIGDGTYGIRVSAVTAGVSFTVEQVLYSNTSTGEIGFEDSNLASRNIENTTVTSIPVSTARFLTNAPMQKFIERNSSEFLYFILKRRFTYALKVKGDLYFYDGSTELGVTLYDISTAGTNYGGVFCLAAGYNQLNLAQYEVGGRKIRRLDFAVYQTVDAVDTPYTEVRTYRFEIDEQPRRYGVVFLNKLGTWDIFDFKGEVVESVARDAKFFNKPRVIGHTGASPKGFEANSVYDTKIVKTIEANTGWINKEHFVWLMDLLASNKIYCYTQDEEPFLMVGGYEYKSSSNDDLFNIDVTFIETLQENNISV